MKKFSSLPQAIMTLAARADLPSLTGLLMLWRIYGADTFPDAHTPWNDLGDTPPEQYADAIRHLLPPEAVDLLPKGFWALSGSAQEDARCLQQLHDLLSCASPDELSPADIFTHRLILEMPAGSISSGDFYTPASLVGLMCGLLDFTDGSLYDPCCGSGALLAGAVRSFPGAKLQLYGQTMDERTYRLCRINLFLMGLSVDLGGRAANTLTKDLHSGMKFDWILANPPFNLSNWCGDALPSGSVWQYGVPPRSNGNFAWLQHIICRMGAGSRAAVVLPNGALTSQVRAERRIREGILRDGLVEAVISLPPGLFYSTKIPCSIWLLHKSEQPASNVLMIDARELHLREDGGDTTALTELVLRRRAGESLQSAAWYAVVPTERIAANRALLSPNLYTAEEPISSASVLQDREQFLLLTDQLCRRLKDDDLAGKIGMWAGAADFEHWEQTPLATRYEITRGVEKSRAFFGRGVPMADLKTVLRHPFLPETLTQAVDISGTETEKFRLRAGDILMGRTSETTQQLGCCCVVPEDRAAVYSGYLHRLRPYEAGQPDSFYMAGFFQSAVYRRQVERLVPVYTTRANMNLDILSRIVLYYPDQPSQKALGDTLYSIYLYRQRSGDAVLNTVLDEFARLLIEQFITYPVLRLKEENAEI